MSHSQEGWRLEHEKPSDKASPIIFKGVVYNEMKGAFVSDVWMPVEQLIMISLWSALECVSEQRLTDLSEYYGRKHNDMNTQNNKNYHKVMAAELVV